MHRRNEGEDAANSNLPLCPRCHSSEFVENIGQAYVEAAAPLLTLGDALDDLGLGAARTRTGREQHPLFGGDSGGSGGSHNGAMDRASMNSTSFMFQLIE